MKWLAKCSRFGFLPPQTGHFLMEDDTLKKKLLIVNNFISFTNVPDK